MQDLPKTANLKLIDWWLLFASNVLAITMAFHTYLAYMCSGKGKTPPIHEGFRLPRVIRFGRFGKRKEAKDEGVRADDDGGDKAGQGNNETDVFVMQPSAAGGEAGNEEDKQKIDKGMLKAHRFNAFAKVVYLAVVVIFNVAFWSIAIREYYRPAEEYLEEEDDDVD